MFFTFLDYGGWDMVLIKILGVSGQLVAAVILLRCVLSFLCHSDAAVSLLRLELPFLYHSDASEQRTLLLSAYTWILFYRNRNPNPQYCLETPGTWK